MSQPKPPGAGTKSRKGITRAQYKRGPNIPHFKVQRIKGRRLAGQHIRTIAEAEGVSTFTVQRILSQDESRQLMQAYRDNIMTDIVPEAVRGLKQLVIRRDRQAIIETLYGTKVFAQRHEVEQVNENPERDYADTKIEFYYKYGRWPTEAEAKEFDKTIVVEPLVKKRA